MNKVTKVVETSNTVLTSLSSQYGMNENHFKQTVLATCSPKGRNAKQLTEPEFYTLLMAAQKYKLNPLMREIYAFQAQGGGIQVVVGVDGWMNLINSHPDFDGMDFEDHREGKKITAITCRMYRKDRKHPIQITEYLEECERPTEPWKKWPIRMLRHKAAIQAARYAFGFSNIMEPDEAERVFDEVTSKDIRQDLEDRRIDPGTKEGFDLDRIKNDLSQAQGEQQDVTDIEPEQDSQQQENASQSDPEAQSDDVTNLTEGQLELLGEIEEKLSGCRSGADIDALCNEYMQDVMDAGQLFQEEANKAVHKRRAELQ